MTFRSTARACGAISTEVPLGAPGELARLVERAAPREGTNPLSRFGWAFRASGPTPPFHRIYTPVLCIVAQGRKQVVMGGDNFLFDTERCFLISIAVPGSGQVLDATPAHPYLSLAIALELATVASVIGEAGLAAPRHNLAPRRAMDSWPVSALLLDAVARLVRACAPSPEPLESQDAPDAQFLGPMALREIIYRLLTGPQQHQMHQVAARNGETARVGQALVWLRQNYAQPLSIPALARHCGMSASALHQSFKQVTAMTPLQYQKQMRLQEARRLMSSEGLDAARAGYAVGYGDASHFSRDYKRVFGEPPRQHAARTHSEVW